MTRNDGSRLEDYVQFVYETLLNFKGNEHTIVTRGAVLQGRGHRSYKVDVFYEFERAGINHRVVIECKDYATRRVEMAEVIEFKGKIEEIGRVVGVMVSRSGYQQGAKDYAKDYDLLLLEEHELPTIGSLLADRIISATMPDEACVGEPFWTLMEVRNGRLTGSYYAMEHGDGVPRVPLFIARSHARFFLKNGTGVNSYVIRGLPQRVLRGLIIIAKSKRAEVGLIYGIPQDLKEGWPARVLTPDELEEEFLVIPL